MTTACYFRIGHTGRTCPIHMRGAAADVRAENLLSAVYEHPDHRSSFSSVALSQLELRKHTGQNLLNEEYALSLQALGVGLDRESAVVIVLPTVNPKGRCRSTDDQIEGVVDVVAQFRPLRINTTVAASPEFHDEQRGNEANIWHNTRTCFYLGVAHIKNNRSAGLVCVWATARHETDHVPIPVTAGTDWEIKMRTTCTVNAHCVHDDVLSDVAFLVTDYASTNPTANSLIHRDYTTDIRAGQRAYVAGFYHLFPSNSAVPASCIVAAESVDGPPPGNVHSWRANRFFVVDKRSNCGFDGGPCFDSAGHIKGLMSSSWQTQFSWILKAEFLRDAFTDAFEYK